MVLCNRPERVPILEPVFGKLLLAIRQVLHRHPQVVWVFDYGQQILCLLQADLLHAR